LKATKYSVTIEVEALSLDAVPGLVMKAVQELQGECVKGSMQMNDGDTVSWIVLGRPVEM